jgi:hypothetical protein
MNAAAWEKWECKHQEKRTCALRSDTETTTAPPLVDLSALREMYAGVLRVATVSPQEVCGIENVIGGMEVIRSRGTMTPSEKSTNRAISQSGQQMNKDIRAPFVSEETDSSSCRARFGLSRYSRGIFTGSGRKRRNQVNRDEHYCQSAVTWVRSLKG